MTLKEVLLEEVYPPIGEIAVYNRRSWESELMYCYTSDIDFCLILNHASADEDSHWSYIPDLIADDWEIKFVKDIK